MLSPGIGIPLAVLAFFLPGLTLVRRDEWGRAEPIELAAIACAGSASWWAVGIWFIGAAGISLAAFALGSLAASALVLAVFRRPGGVACLRISAVAAKKILLLGATGGTGRAALSQAIAKGREVTVLVRSRERLGATPGHARVLVGDILDERMDLSEVVRGQDAVVSALGTGNSLRSHDLIGRAVPRIVRAMENAGVSRFILTSAYGVGDTMRDVPLLPRVLMLVLLRDLYADKQAAERVLRESSIDWTIVHPVTLTNGPRTGNYRAGERLKLSGFPRISRADVADFLLAQVEDRAFSRRDVMLGPGRG